MRGGVQAYGRILWLLKYLLDQQLRPLKHNNAKDGIALKTKIKLGVFVQAISIVVP
jgi:hypothetical protein